ncbi:hypothetical protein [Priestia megaterium]|uniref:hypothetical protein n=1 Tax=Priestia megaterium TaxID=1404 RepID=UPI0023DBBA97|nr:hypothetical protein [Priestia megaterium]MDF2010245.1 hypothetical protein [Priestia megaterium]
MAKLKLFILAGLKAGILVILFTIFLECIFFLLIVPFIIFKLLAFMGVAITFGVVFLLVVLLYLLIGIAL